MNKTLSYPNWKEKVVYPAEGAQPKVLDENEKFKVIVAGLEAGQKIPSHPESSGVYFFLEGSGVMVVNEEHIPVEEGATVIVPDGGVRGVNATTRLAFLAVRAAG
jgi:mannose-6-phosphate isomerase-like protein (cupin superfamily)